MLIKKKTNFVSTLDQIYQVVRYNEKNKKTKSVITYKCKELLKIASDNDKALFIRVFNKLIYQTNKYFLLLPLHLRSYYCHMFEKKMYNFIERELNKHLEDIGLKSYLICLYKAYAKETIVKDWNAYRQKHWYMNPNYPYEVK